MAAGREFEKLFCSPADGEDTFSRDATLPSMPVPSLKHTIDRFLDSVKPHVTNDKEYSEIEHVAREFENGEGKELHKRLLARAKYQKNWVERWWLEQAYLRLREPLLPFYSMCGPLPLSNIGWSTGKNKMINHASLYLYNLVHFWRILRKERLKPNTSADKKTYFSMSQFRYLFNCVRVPQEDCDELITYFKSEKEGHCPSHVIILCNGRIFCVNAVTDSGMPITHLEWERQLHKIYSLASEEQGPGVGILTCDDRTAWAKNRKHLLSICKENEEIMKKIDMAIFVAVLDKEKPSNESETLYRAMNGDYFNRWLDKSIQPVFFENGAVGGSCDHTAFDGAISVTTLFYVYAALQNSKENVSFVCEKQDNPVELVFTLDKFIESQIERTEMYTTHNATMIALVHDYYKGYGKDFIQSHRCHPDSFVQMALQLAYFRMHGKPAPTYETATTRAYYNGRTETLRSCTVEALDWAKSMLLDNVSVAEKRSLLKKALEKHDFLMSEAKNNSGCDRHLLGLYCVAVEDGLPIPSLYSHPAYKKSGGGGNFKLSTSLLGYTPIGGGCGPMCLHGYGCFYNLLPDRLCFTVTVFKASQETSAMKFFSNLCLSLDDMKHILETRTSKM